MKKESQMSWTRTQLITKGRVSRNQALRRYYSRLGARIADLRREGMNIQGYWKTTKSGKDYVYELVK